MSSELRSPAFRAALAEAQRELEEITERYAMLSRRKELLEFAVASLEPMMSSRSTQPFVPQTIAEPALVLEQPAPAPASVVEMPSSDRKREVITDPLQRQINQALGLAALA